MRLVPFWSSRLTIRPNFLVGIWLVLGMLFAFGCARFESKEKPQGAASAQRAEPSANASTISPTVVSPPAPSAAPSGSAAPSTTELAPHPGPWFTVLQPSAAIYSKPSVERSSKLGYAQSGARLPVLGRPKAGEKCSEGWLELAGGGYVCASAGTMNEKEGRAKFTIRRPDLTAILPYTYARNAKNGTPLYRTVPTRAQMLEYEPYLKKDTNQEERTKTSSSVAEARQETPSAKASNGDEKTALKKGDSPMGASGKAPAVASAGVPSSPASSVANSAEPAIAEESDPTEQPWWQRDGMDDKLHELKLDDLKEGADGILVQRMVKGFYVAVDRTFHWNGRTWYKTTKGLVAPADRMGQASPSDFHGVELSADVALPLGWLYGGREKTQTFEVDPVSKKVKVKGIVERFVVLPLTDETFLQGGTTYRKMTNGLWVRQSHLRITEPGPPPADVKDNEHWVDVDLSSQTLVVFEGQKPIYATLISSGKSSKIKEKDHATPTGQWRIREKHITATMDGDGTNAGDQPYSIEDVPFVMYFHKSYALHGAFWHRNYGAQMSHGCVNLSPLDAKAVFAITEPRVSEQWHGAWSSDTSPGSWVVVHE